MNNETKIISKKLRTGNMNFYTDTLIQLLAEGWVKPKEARTIFDGTTVRLTLHKEVNIDSTEPDTSETNCRPSVLQASQVWVEPSNAVNESVEPSMGIAEVGVPPQDIKSVEQYELMSIPDIKLTGSVIPFEQRPYTKEELSSWDWVDLKKLGGLCGAGIGDRDKITNAIVAKSAASWG